MRFHDALRRLRDAVGARQRGAPHDTRLIRRDDLIQLLGDFDRLDRRVRMTHPASTETPADPRLEAAGGTHPGFRIICEKCGSEIVIVDSDVGFSAVSGGWGGVHLKCQDCDNETAIWETS
jgi:ribosomal protein S27E